MVAHSGEHWWRGGETGGEACPEFWRKGAGVSFHQDGDEVAVLQPDFGEDDASSVPMSGQAAQWSVNEGGRSDLLPGSHMRE
jgi:hypothetical protein